MVGFKLRLKNSLIDGSYIAKFNNENIVTSHFEIVFNADDLESGLKMFRVEDVKSFEVFVY